MKIKKIFALGTLATAVGITGWNHWYASDNDESLLILENVEALSYNDVQVVIPCYKYPTTCTVNLQDLQGNVITKTFQCEIKAAPYK